MTPTPLQSPEYAHARFSWAKSSLQHRQWHYQTKPSIYWLNKWDPNHLCQPYPNHYICPKSKVQLELVGTGILKGKTQKTKEEFRLYFNKIMRGHKEYRQKQRRENPPQIQEMQGKNVSQTRGMSPMKTQLNEIETQTSSRTKVVMTNSSKILCNVYNIKSHAHFSLVVS